MRTLKKLASLALSLGLLGLPGMGLAASDDMDLSDRAGRTWERFEDRTERGWDELKDKTSEGYEELKEGMDEAWDDLSR